MNRKADQTSIDRRALRHLRRADLRFGELIKQVGPYCPTITANPFNTLIGSIVHQQISMAAATTIQKRLKARCPRRRITPAAILALSDDDLRGVGLSRQKAHYVRSIAEHFASGALTTRRLRRLSDEDVIAATTRIVGIGRWTAEMLLIFCLERPDVWPVDDLGLRKALGRFLGRDDGVDAKSAMAVGDPWRPYRTYACWYLWRSLESPILPGVST
ncbi:MAG: DNA-3-methyladenine glycosylase [Planctomycetota bacterium]